MCEKAIKYLKKYTEDIVEEKNKMHVSYDLWEMCEGTHLYSLAAIYAAFETMEKIYDKIYDDYEENRIKQEKIRKERKEYQELKLKIKNYIAEKLYDKERKTYVRNTQDKKLDISIIGAVTPFKLYTPKEKKITNTIENIDLSLRTYTGGYKRFEEDQLHEWKPMDNSNTMDGRIPHTKRRKKQSNRRTKLRSKISKPTRAITRTSKQRKNGTRMGNRSRLGTCNVHPNNKKIILNRGKGRGGHWPPNFFTEKLKKTIQK